MPDRARRRPRRTIPLAVFTIVALAIAVTVAAPRAVDAASPTVAVDPAGALPTSGATITVRGSGFDAASNGGVGVYVVFGPRTAAPTYYTDALLYLAARWVHRGAGDSPGQAELAADGSFVTTLDVQPRFTDGHGTPVDCLVVECVVVTMAAHGAADRSADTFTAVGFSTEASAAPVAPSSSASPVTPASSASPASLGPAMVVALIGLVVLGVALAAMLARRAARRGAR